jgi:putative oxidoreductase
MTSRELKEGPLALCFLAKYRDAGLFVLRVGIGVCYMAHGWGKISNPDGWEGLGGAIGALGFTVPPLVAKVFGFLAALSEFGGGICLILGFLFRPACIMMAGTMGVALATHLKHGDPFVIYSHPLENLILFFSLIFIGPGKISIERN